MSDIAKDIILINIEDEMKRSYLGYAVSMIIARALPDVRAGQKPVQRRILMAMHDLNLNPSAPLQRSPLKSPVIPPETTIHTANRSFIRPWFVWPRTSTHGIR